jgi:hypothetical protein
MITEREPESRRREAKRYGVEVVYKLGVVGDGTKLEEDGT